MGVVALIAFGLWLVWKYAPRCPKCGALGTVKNQGNFFMCSHCKSGWVE